MNKRIAIILGLGLFLSVFLSLVSAQGTAQEEISTFLPKERLTQGESSPDNVQMELIPELQSVLDTVNPFLRQLSFFIGGIFGLYLILMIARVYYERKSVKILKDIRYDLDRLNMHYGLSCSHNNKGFFRRIIGFFKRRSYDKELHKANINKINDKELKNTESKHKK